MQNLKKYTYSFLVLLIAPFLFSCTKELETYPRASLTPDIALSDSTAYQGLLMSAYRRMHEFTYYGQNMILTPEVLADNAVVLRNTGRFIDEFNNVQGEHIDIWFDVYRAINDCNYVLADIDDPNKGAALASLWFKKRIAAEALAVRSLIYHDLARIYGYEPNKEKNGWKQSAVLRIKPTLGKGDIGSPTRSTNNEIYSQIEEDLNKALTLLAEIPPTSNYKVLRNGVTPIEAVDLTKSVNYFRFNAPAIQALLARVQLYSGNYTQALQNAEAVISIPNNIGGAEFVNTSNYVQAFNNGASNSGRESLFELNINPTDWSTVDGQNNGLSSLTSDRVTGGQFVLGASQQLYNLFGTGDTRRSLMVDKGPSETGYNRWMVNKWTGEKTNATGGVENVQVMRKSEVVLIKAECQARNGNLNGAMTTLNDFRTTRGASNLATPATLDGVLDLILLENRLEFYFEGHRFFDLKRMQKGIVKPTGGNITASDLAFDDYRFLARIPTSEININPGLTQNPGY